MANGIGSTAAAGTLGVGGRSFALTGSQATAALGNLSIEGGDVSLTLSGRFATAERGSLGAGRTFGLTGTSGFSAAGRQRSYLLASQLGTGAGGILVGEAAPTLSGRQARGALGALTAEAVNGGEIVGQEATSTVGVLTPDSIVGALGVEGLSDSGDLSSTSPTVTAIVGTSAVGELGTALTEYSRGFVGHGVTSAVGTLVPSIVPTALVGNSATSARGNLTNAKYALRVSWTASADADVTGYYVGWGTSSNAGATSITAYPNVVDVSGRLTTSLLISGLSGGVLYYANITSHGSGGHDQFESLPLGEISSFASPELPGMLGTTGLGTLTPVKTRGIVGRIATGALGVMSASVETFSATLSGQAGQGQVGEIVEDRESILVGQEATGAFGALGYVYGPLLEGVTGTEELGAFVLGSDTGVVGVEATPSIGTLSFNLSEDRLVELSALPASGYVGNMGVEWDTALAGVDSSGAVGSLGFAKGGTIALSGVGSTGRVGTFFIPFGATEGADAIDELVIFRRRR